jgi:phosphoglycerate dehydrogenase-like enzyme
MSRPRVVFLHGLPQTIVDAIVSHTPDGFETVALGGSASEGQREEAVAEADFIIVYGADLNDRLLRAAGKARLVQLLAAGYDGMDLDLMQELQIPCANNGGANSWAVADHALLLMLALYKRLLPAERSTREGRWREPIDGLNTFEMAGKLVGILGMGNIGRQVARRVQAFDATVQYYDKYPLSPERERELGVTRVSLDELFRTSDIVSCHTPLTPETRHVVSRERIGLMKATSVLINTSRGATVDEGALIDALSRKKIAGAGLDVFEEEPVDTANPLLRMDNVVVTPHSAGTTWDTWARRAEFAYDNIERVWKGGPPLAVVDGT